MPFSNMPNLNGDIITTNTTGPVGTFTPIVNNGTVTVVPSNIHIQGSTGQQGVSGWTGHSGYLGTSGYSYNLTGHPDPKTFKSYIRLLEGKVLECVEKVEDEKFVVPRYYAMRFIYQFLEQIPYRKTLKDLETCPVNDEIHRLYWRKSKAHEQSKAISYDEAELDEFIKDAEDFMHPVAPYGISGAQNPFGSSILCSGVVSNVSVSSLGLSIGSGFSSGLTVDPQGNVHINGNVTISGKLNVGVDMGGSFVDDCGAYYGSNNSVDNGGDNSSVNNADQFLTTCQANENGDIMTWAGGGAPN